VLRASRDVLIRSTFDVLRSTFDGLRSTFYLVLRASFHIERRTKHSDLFYVPYFDRQHVEEYLNSFVGQRLLAECGLLILD
jgi:hypothetical protein